MLVTLRVIPRASKACVAGVRGDALLVRLTAPPVEGAANAALIQLLARVCGVPVRAVAIVTGERGRLKTVLISGLTLEAATERLGLGLQTPGN